MIFRDAKTAMAARRAAARATRATTINGGTRRSRAWRRSNPTLPTPTPHR